MASDVYILVPMKVSGRFWMTLNDTTPCPDKNGPPPKHVKIIWWIEKDNHYFNLYREKPSICNVCMKLHDN